MGKMIYNRQQLLDDLADLKAEYQHARRCGNTQAMALCVTDMTAIHTMLACQNNIVITNVVLEN